MRGCFNCQQLHSVTTFEEGQAGQRDSNKELNPELWRWSETEEKRGAKSGQQGFFLNKKDIWQKREKKKGEGKTIPNDGKNI